MSANRAPASPHEYNQRLLALTTSRVKGNSVRGTKESAIIIDEENGQSHQLKRGSRPPEPVVDLTLSDDEVIYMGEEVTYLGSSSTARSAMENTRSNRQNAELAPKNPSVHGNENTARNIPRTNPLNIISPKPVDHREGMKPSGDGEKGKERRDEPEEPEEPPSPSDRFLNFGLPARTKLPKISKTDGSSSQSKVTQATPSIHSTVPHASSANLATPERLAPPQKANTTSSGRDEANHLGTPIGVFSLQYDEQTSFRSNNNSLMPPPRDSNSRAEEITRSKPLGPPWDFKPSPSTVALLQQKQRAARSANKLRENKTSTPQPTMHEQLPTVPEEEEASKPPTHSERSNGSQSLQSPYSQDRNHEPMQTITPTMGPPMTEKQKSPVTSVAGPSEGVVHSEEKDASATSVFSRPRAANPTGTLPGQISGEISQEMVIERVATKSYMDDRPGPSNAQASASKGSEINSDDHVPAEEILLIDVDDFNTAQSAVDVCLKQNLADRHELHANLTKNKMWRQRICFESEFRAQHNKRRKPAPPGLPKKYIQEVSPFKDMEPIEKPFSRASLGEGVYDFSQEIFVSSKPKDFAARSGWVSSTTEYNCTAVRIPAFKQYVSVKNNVLTDNQSKLLATPYFQDEDDESRMELRASLPQFYEMKHDMNALSDLRSEQCRFYQDTIEIFLRRIDVSWSAILYWLLASDSTIKRINDSFVGNSGFEGVLLQRKSYQYEVFTRDEEPREAELFDRKSERRRRLLSTLEEPTTKQIRLSALACAAVLAECGFSIWYLAEQSSLMSQYISSKIQAPQTNSKATWRDAVCRVCHQHFCVLHGELREVPEDTWETKSDSSGHRSPKKRVFKDFEEDDSSFEDEGMLPRHEKQHQSSRDDQNSDDDEPAPAHWDDDSDIERVINYKLPTNPDAFNTNPEAEMIQSRGSNPPNGQFRINWWKDNTYAHRWEKRKPFYPCSHEGACEQAKCRCFRENITCEKTCKCSRSCKRRFPGCTCAKTSVKRVCASSGCICLNFNRECDADLCGTCGASEILDPVNKYNQEILEGRCFNVTIQRGVPKKTLLGHSEVHGFGLYVGEDIKKDEYIGEYVGETVSMKEGARRYIIYNYQQTMYLFTLNKKQEVDATFMGNKLRFINDANKQHTNCAPRNLLCNTVSRLALYATRDIKAGTELFFHYQYPKDATAHFKQPRVKYSGEPKDMTDMNKLKTKPKIKRKAMSKASSSLPFRSPTSSALKQSPDVRTRINAGLQKARAAKKKKREVMLAEKARQILGLDTSNGPHKARKSAIDQFVESRQSSEAPPIRRGLKSARQLKNEKKMVIQDTDEDDTEFVPQGAQEDMSDSDRSTNRPRRRKAMLPDGIPKTGAGVRSLAGRKRPIVLNSDEE